MASERSIRAPEWQAIGRELIRLGYCSQSTEKFSVLELTPAGLEVLRARKPVKLTRPVVAPDKPPGERRRAAGEITCDEALFATLRALRREAADARRRPPPHRLFRRIAPHDGEEIPRD